MTSWIPLALAGSATSAAVMLVTVGRGRLRSLGVKPVVTAPGSDQSQARGRQPAGHVQTVPVDQQQRGGRPQGVRSFAQGRVTVVLPTSTGIPASSEATEVPVWRSQTAHGVARLHADGVDVDRDGTWCLADSSAPGAAESAMCPVRAVSDSGSDPSSVSKHIMRKLQACFRRVVVTQSMEGVRRVQLVDGSFVYTKQKACPLPLALQAEWGPVALEPFSFAVMPDEDATIILGGATLETLGFYEWQSCRPCAPESYRLREGGGQSCVQ